jgi:hypothetical protein|tara:strand:- start:857 stop:1021 length:165 start_codon:yes stop_codon:yes gene_type:complete
MDPILPVMSLLSLALAAALVAVYFFVPADPGALITPVSDRHLQGRYVVPEQPNI